MRKKKLAPAIDIEHILRRGVIGKLAPLLRVSTQAIYKWKKSGGIPDIYDAGVIASTAGVPVWTVKGIMRPLSKHASYRRVGV